MNDESIFIKSGDQKKEITRLGRVYRLKIKSEKIETIVAELEPKIESRWYRHLKYFDYISFSLLAFWIAALVYTEFFI